METLDEISGHLDGHPLAIKLAAAMVGSDSLETIRQRVLAAPHKKVSERFDFSYNPLPESEKELLHQMAAFASSATEVVIQMTSTLPLFEGDATAAHPTWRDDLSELVRKSFVDTVELSAFDESGEEIKLFRYRLHPLMRQYASGKAGEEKMKNHRRRAANLFLAYAGAFEDNYDALQAERENILAGMDWAVEAQEAGKPEQRKEAAQMVTQFAWAIGKPASGYLGVRGYWPELRRRLEEAAEAAAF
jgi:predicted ATPase